MTLNDNAKCKGKLTSQKSENVHFDGLLLSRAYEFLDKKVQKSYVL